MTKLNSRTKTFEFLPKFGLLGIVIALTVFRAPEVFMSPRFWAEEGSVWFSHAVSSGFFEHLFFFPRRTAGYFLVGPNIATAIGAHWIPIEYAPVISLGISFAIQMVPFMIVITGTSYLWDSLLKKLVVCLILLFAPSNHIEVWLNTINSQVYSGLTILCVLLEPSEGMTRRRRWLFSLVVLFSGLNGIYATFLAPFFLIKHVKERTVSSRLFLLFSFFTSLIQVGVFLYLLKSSGLSSKKFSQESGLQWKAIVMYHWFQPVVGNLASRYMKAFPIAFENVWAYVGALIGLVLLTFRRWSNWYEFTVLFFGFFLVSVLTAWASVGGVPAWRYGVLPGCLLLFLLYAQVQGFKAPLRDFMLVSILLLSLYHGVRRYKFPYSRSRPCPSQDCPEWRKEVIRWRSDPSSPLGIWPAGWQMKIKG